MLLKKNSLPDSEFLLKIRYRTHRFAIRAVFRLKFDVEFTRQAMNFSIRSESARVTRDSKNYQHYALDFPQFQNYPTSKLKERF